MKKYRTTRQEQLIYEVMLEKRIHPTIKDIYMFVKEKDNKIGQATIYRNINKLIEQGYIRKIYIDMSDVRYDIEMSPHAHMCCSSCKRIYDIDDNEIINYNKYLLDKYEFDIASIEVNIMGICKNCKIEGGK